MLKMILILSFVLAAEVKAEQYKVTADTLYIPGSLPVYKLTRAQAAPKIEATLTAAYYKFAVLMKEYEDLEKTRQEEYTKAALEKWNTSKDPDVFIIEFGEPTESAPELESLTDPKEEADDRFFVGLKIVLAEMVKVAKSQHEAIKMIHSSHLPEDTQNEFLRTYSKHISLLEQIKDPKRELIMMEDLESNYSELIKIVQTYNVYGSGSYPLPSAFLSISIYKQYFLSSELLFPLYNIECSSVFLDPIDNTQKPLVLKIKEDVSDFVLTELSYVDYVELNMNDRLPKDRKLTFKNVSISDSDIHKLENIRYKRTLVNKCSYIEKKNEIIVALQTHKANRII